MTGNFVVTAVRACFPALVVEEGGLVFRMGRNFTMRLDPVLMTGLSLTGPD